MKTKWSKVRRTWEKGFFYFRTETEYLISVHRSPKNNKWFACVNGKSTKSFRTSKEAMNLADEILLTKD